MGKQQTPAGPREAGLAARIATAVTRVPGVGGLTDAWSGAATFAPGGRVEGIHLRPHVAEIYIRANALPLPPVGAAAAKAAARVLREAGDSRQVCVNIEDLDESLVALPAAEGNRKGEADAHR